MPGRIYSAMFNDVTVATATAQDFFELVAPATACVELLEVHLSQQTETGDAAEEMLNVAIRTGHTSSGSAGSSPTVVPRQLGDAAAESTVEANNTSKASGGTIVTHAVYWWNIRVPLDVIFTPETTVILSPSARLVVELIAGPTDAVDVSGFVVFREIGGA